MTLFSSPFLLEKVPGREIVSHKSMRKVGKIQESRFAERPSSSQTWEPKLPGVLIKRKNKKKHFQISSIYFYLQVSSINTCNKTQVRSRHANREKNTFLHIAETRVFVVVGVVVGFAHPPESVRLGLEKRASKEVIREGNPAARSLALEHTRVARLLVLLSNLRS